MYLLMYIYILVLRIIYFFMKFMPTHDRVVFISRQSDKLPLDFKLIINEIKNISSVEIVSINKRMDKSSLSVIKSTFTILKSMRYLATSRMCVIDGYNIAVSTLNHKKDLKVLQLWHSLGAIKKFGYQSLNTKKDKKIAKIMCMHKNYDYINGFSDLMTEYYMKAFNYDRKYFKSFGLPRTDYLIKNEKNLKKKVYLKYPELRRKKIILYVPTFRDNDDYKINELIESIDLKKYALVIKVHPKMNIDIEKRDNVYTCSSFSSMTLLTIANYVITDYSGMAIEAASINKPLYLYVYDIENYKKFPGLNLDLEKEFPGYVFKDPQKLYLSINKGKYNMEILEEFKNKYVVSTDKDITKNIAKFIIEGVGKNEEED